MNYVDTFITVSPDCPVTESAKPPRRGSKPTIPEIQFDLISNKPYKLTQEDVL